MVRYHWSSQLFAMCLSAVAGYVDAVGFLKLGGFFASFMTGNSTKLAIGLVNNRSDAATAASLVATFVLGVMLGSVVSRLGGRRGGLAVLCLVTGLLLAAAALHAAAHDSAAVTAMVLAMGAENAAFQQNGEVAIGLTYMTGTLVKAGQRLAAALFGGDRWAWLPYGLLWFGLVTGAVLGAAFYTSEQLGALWIAAVAMGGLTGMAALRPSLLGEPATPRGGREDVS